MIDPDSSCPIDLDSWSASSAWSAASTTASDPKQDYLDAVNALCDALLPKILAVTNGGDPSGFTVGQYLAQTARHARLERGFDRQLARVAVPPSAADASAALHAYVRYADRIDAARLAAAHRGQAAFDREIAAERSDTAGSAIISARDAAGFAESCNAR